METDDMAKEKITEYPNTLQELRLLYVFVKI